MDYDEKFYRDLVPPSETHKHLVIWSYMVNLNGRPRCRSTQCHPS